MLHFVSSLCDPGPHAFMLRVRTALHFNEKQRQQFQTHLGLLGNRVWDHAVVMFDTTNDLSADRSIEEHIESEGEALQWLVEKCRNRYVHWTGEESWPDLLKKIDEMVVQNGGSHFQYEEGRTHETTAADWKTEMQQLVEIKEENKLANSMMTPPLMGGDDRSEISSAISGYRYCKPITDTASVAQSEHTVMSLANSMMTPPLMGGDDRSEITSVTRYRKPITDTPSEASSEHTVMSLANSMMTPPLMGGDDRSEITSVTRYRKPITDTPSEASSEHTVMSLANSMMTPPLMGGDDRSEISSAISGYRYRKPITDTASEAHSEHTVMSLANSMMTPPLMGGDDRSDITSVTSGYGSHISDTTSETPSEQPSTSSGTGVSNTRRPKRCMKHKIPEVEEKGISSAQKKTPRRSSRRELAS